MFEICVAVYNVLFSVHVSSIINFNSFRLFVVASSKLNTPES